VLAALRPALLDRRLPLGARLRARPLGLRLLLGAPLAALLTRLPRHRTAS
jgi:hypothetical protein